MKYILTFILILIISSITYSQEVSDTVIISNAFTPTMGNNNTFSPSVVSDDYTMCIYNRWGNIVYEGKVWDGKFNSNLCDQGVYIWHIKLINGKNFHGTVSLIR